MRKGFWLSSFLTASMVLASASALVAHHSVTAEFDTSKKITFTGTVKKVEWGNPHIYTLIESKDDNGKVVVYRVEGSAPNCSPNFSCPVLFPTSCNRR